ncbi:MAG TPA: zinc-binding alcohol dehydrogenase family protein [Rhizomicrobium sp.]|jgi:NADPH:quinone reductase-like Zn-dependent oxidoreductase|nr:zinc-binding alcohol dehydrogenase family protein [Rhizomicrobium sp.]
MKALRFAEYGPPSVLVMEERETPRPGPGQSLVQVQATAINPSDVKNVAGAFRSPLPRTPGRDYAGIVVDGAGKGRKIWGSGPAFGIARDGSHAQYIVIPENWLSDKPGHLSMAEAAAIGVPFLAAWDGLVNAAGMNEGETLLVTGAAGAVGRAVIQIAHWKGARVIGADIADRPSEADAFVNIRTKDLVTEANAATGGKGVDIVFDAVGGELFEPCLKCLRVGSRQIAITSVSERRVSFDLIDFYHNSLHLIGVDTLKLDGPEIARILDALKPGFESGQLKPFEVQTWPFDKAVEAYEAAAKGGPAKQVLLPEQ